MKDTDDLHEEGKCRQRLRFLPSWPCFLLTALFSPVFHSQPSISLYSRRRAGSRHRIGLQPHVGQSSVRFLVAVFFVVGSVHDLVHVLFIPHGSRVSTFFRVFCFLSLLLSSYWLL